MSSLTPLSYFCSFFFFNDTATTEIYTLSLHDALPIYLVLVYDDIDLPLGAVRTRMKGSHGGHNGVRSVIEALGTSEIRRVKVGIGRPDRKEDVVDHVLTGFEQDELPVIDAAVAEAAERVLALLR